MLVIAVFRSLLQMVLITQWGSPGSGDGQFNIADSVAVDSSGNVFVTDINNNNVQKFTSDGKFITKWGDGQFSYPSGIAVDSSGNVYVADNQNNRVQKFTSDGAYITRWGSVGSGDGQFTNPQGVAVDSSGNVFVTDVGNNRVQKFTSDGKFITKWGAGQFSYPGGVAVDHYWSSCTHLCMIVILSKYMGRNNSSFCLNVTSIRLLFNKPGGMNLEFHVVRNKQTIFEELLILLRLSHYILFPRFSKQKKFIHTCENHCYRLYSTRRPC